MNEHNSQAAFIKWCTLQEKRYPELGLVYAVPNAAKRSLRLAYYLKSEGLKSGVPDTVLAYPKPPYAGLYMEFKHGKNKSTTNQLIWQAKLRAAGHRVEVVYTVDEAIRVTKEYLNISNDCDIYRAKYEKNCLKK